MRMLAAAAAAALIWTGSAAAQDVGYRAISVGDLRGAEQRLDVERARHPDMPELMLNLAAVYLKTGRTAQAATLYRDVLAAPDVDLDLLSGSVMSSHDIALRGLNAMRTAMVTKP